jgi:hypothetical protein
MTAPLMNPNRVEWSGENPGIYLKDTEDGPWLSLALYFKVVVSAKGRGAGMVVLANPDKADGVASNNFCITDNEPLMRWLIADYGRHFASFKGKVGLDAMTYLKMAEHQTTGDAIKDYAEIMSGGGKKVELRWANMGEPYCVDVPAPQSGTGKQQMYSLFRHAEKGSIIVDGKPLPGKVFSRPFLGGTGRTAFLAFSETWLTPV